MAIPLDRPGATLPNADRTSVFKAAESEYRRRVRDNKMREIPKYASMKVYDGSWQSYEYICSLYEKHGDLIRTDPELIPELTESSWQPRIVEQDGIYLVQSQKNPGDMYEVNYDQRFCTCPSRKQPCKHIGAVSRYLEENLPFTVVAPGEL